nr:zwei Ig domain protein zig-8-like [Cherax quadricarinatus]
MAQLLNKKVSRSRHQGGGWWVGRPQPYFTGLPTNLTLISGQTAYLTCRVHMLGERSVTWMRVRDLHILTVGLVTYTADDRFQVLHSSETDDWTLQLQYTQPRDTGAYKCQVNSDPKIVRTVYLTVTDKRVLDRQLYGTPATPSENGEYGTYILGARERFLQAGSSLSLVCVVTHTLAPPTALLWYHDHHVLDYDSPRGGISLQVEKTGEQTTSRLLLSSVRMSDSGNYTCLPVNAPTASVSVHVNSDELRAAVQQEVFNKGVSGSSPGYHLLTLLLLLLLLLHAMHTAAAPLASAAGLSSGPSSFS